MSKQEFKLIKLPVNDKDYDTYLKRVATLEDFIFTSKAEIEEIKNYIEKNFTKDEYQMIRQMIIAASKLSTLTFEKLFKIWEFLGNPKTEKYELTPFTVCLVKLNLLESHQVPRFHKFADQDVKEITGDAEGTINYYIKKGDAASVNRILHSLPELTKMFRENMHQKKMTKETGSYQISSSSTAAEVGNLPLLIDTIKQHKLISQQTLMSAVRSGDQNVMKYCKFQPKEIHIKNIIQEHFNDFIDKTEFHVLPIKKAIHAFNSYATFFLFKKGFIVENNDLSNILRYAAEVGNEGLYELALKYTKLDTNLTKANNPFYEAVKHGHINMIKRLIKDGINIKSEDCNAIFIAIKNNQITAFNYLIQNNCNIKPTSKENDSLLTALKKNQKEVVASLIEHGFISFLDKETTINLCDFLGRVDLRPTIEFLIKEKFEFKEYSAEVACSAAKYNNIDLLKFIFQSKSFTFNEDDASFILEFAIKMHHIDAARCIIEHFKPINFLDLDIAMFYDVIPSGDAKIAKMLFEYGASATHVNDLEAVASLIKVANYGRIQMMKAFIEAGGNAKQTLSYNLMSALHAAVEFPSLKLVKYLIKNGTDPKLYDINHTTALMHATNSGHLKTVKYLYGITKESEETSQTGDTLLHFAAACKLHDTDVLKFWLDKGLRINQKNYSFETPLHVAAREGNLNAVKLLVERGADVNQRNWNFATPLVVSSGKKSDIALFLISKGADVNLLDMKHNTSLSYACIHGNKQLAIALLKAGADPNHKGAHNETPIIKAVKTRHYQLIPALVRSQASLQIADEDGNYPCHIAAINNDLKSLKCLLDYKDTNIECKNKAHRTPLQEAIVNNNGEIFSFLINKIANVNTKDDFNEMAIHYVINFKGKPSTHPLNLATPNGRKKVVEMLIPLTININEQNKQGQTALYMATSKGQVSIVELLLSAHADPNIADIHKSTPLFVAASIGSFNISKLLILNGAKVDNKDLSEKSPLIEASMKGHIKIVDLLLRNSANIEETSPTGATPLFAAATAGKIEIVANLVNRGAQKEHKNKKGQTPLIGALEGKQIIAASMLVILGANVDACDSKGKTVRQYAEEIKRTDSIDNPLSAIRSEFGVLKETAKSLDEQLKALDKELSESKKKETELTEKVKSLSFKKQSKQTQKELKVLKDANEKQAKDLKRTQNQLTQTNQEISYVEDLLNKIDKKEPKK